MSFNFDPAYLALLKSNRELRKELNSEASINQSNEKKICILIKELEQCNRSISFQDTTIIAHEKEIQELKSQVSDLQKRLRSALKDVDKKESYALDLEQRLSTLEEEVLVLKKKIREITSRKYNKSAGIKDSFNIVKMSQLRFRTNRIESNFKVIRFDSIRSSFNSIRFELKKTGFEFLKKILMLYLYLLNFNIIKNLS